MSPKQTSKHAMSEQQQGNVTSELVREIKYLGVQAKLLGQLESSTKEDVKQTLIAQQAVASQRKFKRISIALLSTVVAMIALVVVQRLITVYFTYKFMIQQLSSNKPSSWPTSGFNTALCVEYPALAGFFGFSNSALPTAAYFCYTTKELWECFKDNQRENLASMFDQSVKGSKDPTAPSNYNAITIICRGWANATGCRPTVESGLCVIPCPTSGVNAANVAMSALHGGIGLAFSGHMLGAVPALSSAAGAMTGIGAVVGAALTAVSSYMNAKANQAYRGYFVNDQKCTNT